jgi:hypothetical protein
MNFLPLRINQLYACTFHSIFPTTLLDAEWALGDHLAQLVPAREVSIQYPGTSGTAGW